MSKAREAPVTVSQPNGQLITTPIGQPTQVLISPPNAEEIQQVALLMQKFPWMFRQQDPRDRVTVGEVIDRYLAGVGDEIGARQRESRVHFLGEFKKVLGHRLVAELAPINLKEFIQHNEYRWKAGNTKAQVHIAVQRAFNWAVENRIIRDNPFRGIRNHFDKKTGRDMTAAEFQAVLRHSDPYFRRFMIAMKLTGARPGELSALRWEHIDWNRGLATLQHHKTARKTRKPRVIIFVPQMMKLLAIIKRDQHGPAAVELRRILQHAPDRTVRCKEVVHRMKQLGFSYRAIYSARETIGAKHKRVGGWAEHGYTVYCLPENAVSLPAPGDEHVFLCSKCRRWNRHGLGQKLYRLRKQVGLPDDCKVYSVRHLFTTAGVKRGVNLKALATLLGHETTVMIERVYCHVNGDFEFLQQQAQAATALPGEKDKKNAMPLPTDAEAWQELLLDKYPRAAPRPMKKRRKFDSKKPLIDAEKVAWRAYQFAVTEVPELAKATDFAVYEWLIERREFAGQLPPSGTTFRRYLHRCRMQIEGMSKRKARRAKPEANGTPSDVAGDPEKGGAS